MRIIAGTYRSRVLAAPAGIATRPTSDRLRETLFNVLAPRIAGARFLDLYAGSGAVGIEALSRGAAQVTFVERAPAALKALRQNLDRFGDYGRRLRFMRGVWRGFSSSLCFGSKSENRTKWCFWIRRMKLRTSMRRRWGCWAGETGLPCPQVRGTWGTPVRCSPQGRWSSLNTGGRMGWMSDMERCIGTRLLEQGDAALSFYARSEQRYADGMKA